MRYLGVKIERARKKLGLSQAELGQRVGVSQTAVCRWETGAKQPSLNNMLKLSKVLEIPMDYLLNDIADGIA